jgi:urea transporter
VLIGVLFWILTVLGCGYAAAAGGKDGRWAALLIICASFLSLPVANIGTSWARTELGVMAVDAALLIGLYALMLRSRRYFPVWMTAFQLISVVTHLATMFAPEFTPRAYRAMGSLWAVPITVSMVLGIWLDSRSTRAAAAAPPTRHWRRSRPSGPPS